jgi:DNA helicase-2/ATP-dependent DNA helicase PcrA
MLHGQTRYAVQSRFLEEIPAGLLKWLTPRSVRSSEPAAPWSGFAAPPPRASSRGDSGFRIGQNVHHQKFGAGVIVGAEGSGMDAKVQVNFKHAGMKWLALAVARLEPVP